MRKLSILLLSTIFLLTGNSLMAQSAVAVSHTTQSEKIKWMSWDEVQKAYEKEPRKIVMDVFTDWCGWCKRMDEVTFQDPGIAAYINDNFYAVKFDAEQKGELSYKEKVYKYVKSGNRGYHELAAKLMRGRLSFPTVIFLDEEQNVIQCIVGFKNAPQFETISTYFGENKYKDVPWSSYEKEYQPKAKK